MDHKSLLEDNGIRFVPGHFAIFLGRNLSQIIDEEGKVFCPNPYDMPKDPQRVLAFALNFIMTMIDTGRLEVDVHGHFSTEEELLNYRKKTREFLSNLNVFLAAKGESIEYQDPGGISQEELAKHLEQPILGT